jgi:hypothetical protein
MSRTRFPVAVLPPPIIPPPIDTNYYFKLLSLVRFNDMKTKYLMTSGIIPSHTVYTLPQEFVSAIEKVLPNVIIDVTITISKDKETDHITTIMFETFTRTHDTTAVCVNTFEKKY